MPSNLILHLQGAYPAPAINARFVETSDGEGWFSVDLDAIKIFLSPEQFGQLFRAMTVLRAANEGRAAELVPVTQYFFDTEPSAEDLAENVPTPPPAPQVQVFLEGGSFRAREADGTVRNATHEEAIAAIEHGAGTATAADVIGEEYLF